MTVYTPPDSVNSSTACVGEGTLVEMDVVISVGEVAVGAGAEANSVVGCVSVGFGTIVGFLVSLVQATEKSRMRTSTDRT